VHEELRRFDEYLDRFAASLRRRAAWRCASCVGCWWTPFADRPIIITAIKPEHLRSFLARQSKPYRTPVNAGIVIAALRDAVSRDGSGATALDLCLASPAQHPGTHAYDRSTSN
jgi:hypothetical protein